VSRGHRLQACHANGGPLHERWRPPVAAAHAAIEAPGAEWQAVAWIKRREGRQLDGRVRLQGDRDFLKQLELALQYGFPFMVASVDEWLDPVLDPLLEKAVSVQVPPDSHPIKHGQSTCTCISGWHRQNLTAMEKKGRFIYAQIGKIKIQRIALALRVHGQSHLQSAMTRMCRTRPIPCCKTPSTSHATVQLTA